MLTALFVQSFHPAVIWVFEEIAKWVASKWITKTTTTGGEAPKQRDGDDKSGDEKAPEQRDGDDGKAPEQWDGDDESDDEEAKLRKNIEGGQKEHNLPIETTPLIPILSRKKERKGKWQSLSGENLTCSCFDNLRHTLFEIGTLILIMKTLLIIIKAPIVDRYFHPNFNL